MKNTFITHFSDIEDPRIDRYKRHQLIQTCFIKWVQDIAKDSQVDVIAIDGKTARRSFSTKERNNALHMVSAWSCSHGLVLGQQKVDGKSNEITAIPALLELLDIEGACITLDAMGCQKDITKAITTKKADYVMALKSNQGSLHEEVKAYFHKVLREKCSKTEHDKFKG